MIDPKVFEKVLTVVVDGSSKLKASPSLDPDLLAAALENFSTFDHGQSPYSPVQLVALFTAIGQTTNLKLKLRSLELSGNNLILYQCD